MSVLILGQTGQVARALAARLPSAKVVGRDQADFERPDRVRELIISASPNVIVNAVAYTAVDAAEDDRDRAFAVNADALAVIGAAAREIGALVVHYSTDYVFDGSGTGPIDEAAIPNPISVYGASKFAGEELLRASGAAHLILRVSWVYAPDGKNFPLTILRLARERDTLNVVNDQMGAPTSAALIADVTASLAGPVSDDRRLGGTYHLAPSGETSWHGFARSVIAEALAQGAALRLTPDSVRPIPSSAFPTKASRPANSRLDTSLLRRTFSIGLSPWQDDVPMFISNLKREGRL